MGAWVSGLGALLEHVMTTRATQPAATPIHSSKAALCGGEVPAVGDDGVLPAGHLHAGHFLNLAGVLHIVKSTAALHQYDDYGDGEAQQSSEGPAEEGGERGGKVGELALLVEPGAHGEEDEVHGGGGGQEGGARHEHAGAEDPAPGIARPHWPGTCRARTVEVSLAHTADEAEHADQEEDQLHRVRLQETEVEAARDGVHRQDRNLHLAEELAVPVVD